MTWKDVLRDLGQRGNVFLDLSSWTKTGTNAQNHRIIYRIIIESYNIPSVLKYTRRYRDSFCKGLDRLWQAWARRSASSVSAWSGTCAFASSLWSLRAVQWCLTMDKHGAERRNQIEHQGDVLKLVHPFSKKSQRAWYKEWEKMHLRIRTVDHHMSPTTFWTDTGKTQPKSKIKLRRGP